MTQAAELIRVTVMDDGVAAVQLDNPPVNALSPEVYRRLDELVVELDGETSVRALVFTSANPKVFAAGADLKKFAAEERTSATVAARVDRAHSTFLRIQRMSKPTIAAIEGHALGGGCELALALDFRIMARGCARIGFPEATLGLIPAAGGTQRLPRLVGRHEAAALLMLAERVDADEAARIGLVRASDDARADAFTLAARLATMSASSLRAIKVCLNDGVDGDLVRGLAVERAAALETFTSDDATEGINAFLEGRPPQFTGSRSTAARSRV